MPLFERLHTCKWKCYNLFILWDIVALSMCDIYLTVNGSGASKGLAEINANAMHSGRDRVNPNIRITVNSH